MGYRIQVSFHDRDTNSLPTAILCANSHHKDVNLDELVKATVKKHQLPSQILVALLQETYPSNYRGHTKGDPIFTLDFEPGDAEKRYAILLGGSEELVRKGYVPEKCSEIVEAPIFTNVGHQLFIGHANKRDIVNSINLIANQSWSNDSEAIELASFMRNEARKLRESFSQSLVQNPVQM